MKNLIQTATSLLVTMLCLGVISPASGQNASMDTSFVLYHYEEKVMRDSELGKITTFQQALSDSLQACGKEGLTVDGFFGPATEDGLIRLLSCPGYEDLAVPATHPLHGTVHSALWKSLLPGTPLPTAHDRAFALVLTHEGTDYDRVQWNYGTYDDKSALTWGPYGATVGWGNEVRGILQRVQANEPTLLKDLFKSEYVTVEAVIQNDADEGYELLKPVYTDTLRRQIWKTALQELGNSKEGRDAYDWYAFQSNKWLKPNLRRLYSLIPNPEQNATEIDYAFFLDIGMHAGVSSSRIETAKQAFDAREEELERSLTPSERRRVIGQVFADAVTQKKDRRGRNVVFYIEGVGENILTEEEIEAWEWRSGFSTSNFGLSDNRKYYPEFLK